jgi:hypothetical protein
MADSVDPIGQWVDLERYPLLRPQASATLELLAQAREQFTTIGAVCLPGFVKPSVLPGICQDMRVHAGHAFYNVQQHNVYFDTPDPSWAHDHPGRRLLRTAQKALAADTIAAHSPLWAIYRWEPLRRFLAQIVDHPAQLQTHADELAALNVMTMDDQDELGWHFDRSDFATTLMLQAPRGGGRYQFVPQLRSASDPALPALGQLLNGQHPHVIELDIQPGTLTFFAGRWSPHRVTPVQGGQRVMAVLGYVREPGAVFSAQERRRFYGRSEVLR